MQKQAKEKNPYDNFKEPWVQRLQGFEPVSIAMTFLFVVNRANKCKNIHRST